jgi:hypothetical protein
MRSLSSRRAAVWLLSIPLMLLGSQVAHAFAYRLVYPNAGVRLHELLETGHGYMGYAPLVAGIGGALEIVAFVWIVTRAVRGRRETRVPPWAFALLPPIAFAFQEILERWLAGGSFPWWAVMQPTFAAGLLLQLPFAFLSYAVARWLLRVAHTVAPELRGTIEPPRLAGFATLVCATPARALHGAVLVAGHPARGPPPLGITETARSV